MILDCERKSENLEKALEKFGTDKGKYHSFFCILKIFFGFKKDELFVFVFRICTTKLEQFLLNSGKGQSDFILRE